jgi:hypothetical protein
MEEEEDEEKERLRRGYDEMLLVAVVVVDVFPTKNSGMRRGAAMTWLRAMWAG